MSQKSFKDALIDLWDGLIPVVGINIIWFVLTILIIPAFPAAGGLYYAMNRLAHGEGVDIKTFFEGFKQHFWTSLKWGFLNLFIYLVLASNIWFYGRYEGFGFLVIQSFFFSLVLIYTCLQIYTFPFLLEQDTPSLINAFKNSFVVFMRYMGKSLGLLAFFLLISTISTLLPPLWVIISACVIIYLSNWQTIFIIREIEKDSNKLVKE